jgi:hypothetical protein|tara:strand:+ start:9488 stop:9634 length:147 start_codon:yes stop_codon:yes gene_type:complete
MTTIFIKDKTLRKINLIRGKIILKEKVNLYNHEIIDRGLDLLMEKMKK